jgi:hypothetical protein
MRSPTLAYVGLILAICSCSCGGKKDATRVPANHRQAGSLCPKQRGPGISEVGSPCAQDGGFSPACLQDSDCIGGADGRCLEFGGPACSFGCTYDECFSDSDCAGNAPCACRASDADSSANTCASQSNCRIDTDCGPDGYCSPSMVGNLWGCMSEVFCGPGEGGCYANGVPIPCLCSGTCGHGFFCHTPKDSCIDDGDCAGGKGCKFDLTSKAWLCAGDEVPL